MSRRIKKWTEEEKEYLKSIVFGRSHDEILKLMNEKFECSGFASKEFSVDDGEGNG